MIKALQANNAALKARLHKVKNQISRRRALEFWDRLCR